MPFRQIKVPPAPIHSLTVYFIAFAALRQGGSVFAQQTDGISFFPIGLS